MGINSRTYSLLLGALVVATLAVVPGAQAAPPPGPNYQCATSAGPADAATATKVMIAGDSITNASAGDYTWTYWLWRNQVDAGRNIDFVGRFKDTIVPVTLEQGSRAYLDCDFDQDDESRPGVKLFTTRSQDSGTYSFGTPANTNPTAVTPYYDGYDSWMQGAADTWNPDVIVLVAGANDLVYTSGEPTASMTAEQRATYTIGKLKQVIDEARQGQPGVDIVLTTVPAATSASVLYNNALPSVVTEKNTPGERVVLATLPSWSAHSWDGLHPDAVGEVRIAATIADTLHVLDPTAFAGRPNPLPAPAVGPRFPATLSAATDGSNRVKLTWTLPPGADRSIVWARNTNGGPWVKKIDYVMNTLRQFYPNDGTAVCFIACTTHTVTGLSGGTTYEFKVQLGKGHAVAPESAVAPEVKTVQATGPIGAVDTPRATAGTRAATVSWTNLAGVSLYDVQWRAGGTSLWKATTSPGSSRVISGLVAGQPYAFRVKPRNASTWSSQVVATPRAAALSPGRRPVLAKVRGVRIRTAWAASAGATRYQVQRRIARGPWRVVATTTKRVLVSGKLKKGKTYEFRIRPYDGLVGGAYSPVARRKAH